MEDFHRIFIETQKANASWIESRFKVVREEFGEWSIDGMMVDPNGRLVAGPWSTYNVYSSGKEFALSMEDIVEAAQKNNTMLYPLTPFRDSTLFWFYHQGEEAIRWVVNEAIGERLEVDNYPIDPGIASEMPDMIRMARIPRGKIGKGKLAKAGMASGRLGFWENISANIYWAGKYIPRVYADKSGVLDRQITISPLREGKVIASGGLPMDEKHPNLEVIRTDPDLAGNDFIAAALVAFAQAQPNLPFVLSYNTYRPWFGEVPRHGEK